MVSPEIEVIPKKQLHTHINDNYYQYQQEQLSFEIGLYFRGNGEHHEGQRLIAVLIEVLI